MNKLDQQQSFEEYLREFILRTNDGRVFAVERSTRDTTSDSNLTGVRTTLTPEETEERDEWTKSRLGLEDNYATHVMSDLTVDDLLQLRVAPPLLVRDLSIPPPNSDREIFPPSLFPDAMCSPWVEFENEVRSFTEPVVEKFRRVDNVLYHSLHAAMKLCDDDGERSYILYQVLEPLQKAGLLEHGTRSEAILLKHAGLLGNPDHFLIAGVNKTVPIVFKTTHDLRIPEKAVDMIPRYNAVALAVKAGQKRTIDWVKIGYPLGQVMNRMVGAGSRYGVLSSGTRTYFFKVEYADDGSRVSISDAWFVGQKDYLRAWSYLYHLAKNNNDDFKLADWSEEVIPNNADAAQPSELSPAT